MTKKSIVSLLIIIVIMVMILDFNINGGEVFESYYKQMETESMDKLNEFQGADFNSEWANKISELVINSDDVDTLQITNVGSINIAGEERNDVEIKAIITVYANRKKQAQEFLPELKIESNKRDKKLTILLREANAPSYINGIKVAYEIKAPEELALMLKNRFGEMEVNNFAADVNLSNRYKMMRVNDIEGKAILHAKYGNLYVNNIIGQSDIYSRYNETVIKNLQNNLVLDSKYSKNKIRTIKGKVDINAGYGELDIDGVKNNIQLNSRYTKITIMDTEGELDADLDYGDFKIYNVRNNINLDSRYTDLYFRLSPEVDNYLIDCLTEYGDIESNLDLLVDKEDNEKIIKGETGESGNKIQIKVNGRYSDIIINR